MDLGIAGKKALVCAASKGLGKGCAMALAEAGVELVILARGKDALEATAAEIRAKTGAEVTALAADITTADGRRRRSPRAPRPTFSSTMPVARRRAIFANGTARSG